MMQLHSVYLCLGEVSSFPLEDDYCFMHIHYGSYGLEKHSLLVSKLSVMCLFFFSFFSLL